MYERIQVKQINDHIWLLDDDGDSTGYLVTGEKSGLIIDTMTGYENVRAVAEKITDLPLAVINTHGHPDHIYGNVYLKRYLFILRISQLQRDSIRTLSLCRQSKRPDCILQNLYR